MNELVKKVIEFQNEYSEILFEDIIKDLDDTIKYQCLKSVPDYQEDVYQEILYAIFKGLSNFKIVENIKTSNQEIKEKFKEISKNKSFVNDEEFDKEFNLFCNEKQFIKYVTKICQNQIKAFYKKNKNYFIERIIYSNTQIQDVDELIDLSRNEYEEVYEKINKYKNILTKKEFIFLIEYVMTNDAQKEIAKKFNITPQAVSIKLKRIRKKIKKI